MRYLHVAILSVTLLAYATPSLSQLVSEHVEWEGWKFDWEVRENTGVAIRNVFYKDEMVLAKASVPVIRVQYNKQRTWYKPSTWFASRRDGYCGPFQDRIKWNDLKQNTECQNRMVCVEPYILDGVKWLEVGGYARIGEYHLYQAWYFSGDGEIRPALQSRGLSCRTTHRHHPYWRLDFAFDREAKKDEQVFVHTEGAQDEGWGPGWHKYTSEVNAEKGQQRTWFVRNQTNGHGVWVIPGSHDGLPDDFAKIDVAVRQYNILEDKPWEFGACGQLGYFNNDSVQEQDIVFWYVAHLRHEAGLGAAAWLTIGPTLKVQR